MSFESPLKTVIQLGDLFCNLVEIGKAGLGWSTLSSLSAVCKEVKGVAKAASDCLPALKDMSEEDAEKLAAASYDMVQKVIKKIAH